MYNYELKKTDLNEITKKLFKEAVFLCYRDGITSIAPLGFSGDTILLFECEKDGRKSSVSIRNYCNSAELLIKDSKGNFLFYGRFLIDLGIDLVTDQYWNIFLLVKNEIESETKEISDFKNVKVSESCELTVGFEMLSAYQKAKKSQTC
jgi:hypothetical protein